MDIQNLRDTILLYCYSPTLIVKHIEQDLLDTYALSKILPTIRWTCVKYGIPKGVYDKLIMHGVYVGGSWLEDVLRSADIVVVRKVVSLLDKLIKSPITNVTIKYDDLAPYPYLLAFVLSGKKLKPDDYRHIERLIRMDFNHYMEYGDVGTLLKHFDDMDLSNVVWLASIIEPCHDDVDLYNRVESVDDINTIFRTFPNATLHVTNTVEFLTMELAKSYHRVVFKRSCEPHHIHKVTPEVISVACAYADTNGIKSIIESALIHSKEMGLKILDMCSEYGRAYHIFMKYVETKDAQYLVDMCGYDFPKQLYLKYLNQDDEYRWSNDIKDSPVVLRLNIKCFHNYVFAHRHDDSATIELCNFDTGLSIDKYDMYVKDLDTFASLPL